jgi:uncharacterized membrane protein YecN with MAPEG domain
MIAPLEMLNPRVEIATARSVNSNRVEYKPVGLLRLAMRQIGDIAAAIPSAVQTAA